MAAAQGYPIVLTADRTLMARYSLLFDGMLVSSQTTSAPHFLVEHLLMPPTRPTNGRARVAPLGLRRIEAALLASGFAADEVAVVDESGLEWAIGAKTRVVGITSGEPLGRGMNSTTMTVIAGGRIYPEEMFRRLLRRVQARLAACQAQARVVLGGPGAWQLARDEAARRTMGVDHVVVGYAEGNAPTLFRSLLKGNSLPEVIAGEGVSAANVPRIRAASTMGVVEISRGCGLGCRFCTLSRVPMIHLPEETILADVETNVLAGQRNAAALSEDLFRYGADGTKTNPNRLLSLLTRLRRIKGLGLIQVDHANLISSAQFTDAELAAVYRLLAGTNIPGLLWVNVGVETPSGALLRANGGAAKMAHLPNEVWGDFCAAQIRRLCRAGFFPLVSLIIGLPGEREEDLRHAREWVETLKDERLAIFPVVYAPVDGTQEMGQDDLKRSHWQLLRACYHVNTRWIPKMYWDNQRAGGVSLGRRLAVQALGRLQAAQWKGLLAYRCWRARP